MQHSRILKALFTQEVQGLKVNLVLDTLVASLKILARNLHNNSACVRTTCLWYLPTEFPLITKLRIGPPRPNLAFGPYFKKPSPRLFRDLKANVRLANLKANQIVQTGLLHYWQPSQKPWFSPASGCLGT